MAFYCYILRCSDGSYYTGHTNNLEHRIAQHQTAERQIKGWSRAKKAALIATDWTALKEAAIPRTERALRLRSGRTRV